MKSPLNIEDFREPTTLIEQVEDAVYRLGKQEFTADEMTRIMEREYDRTDYTDLNGAVRASLRRLTKEGYINNIRPSRGRSNRNVYQAATVEAGNSFGS